MKLQEIQQAVKNGQAVHWMIDSYIVEYWEKNEIWVVTCTTNDHSVGLCFRSAKSEMLNKPEEFYIAAAKSEPLAECLMTLEDCVPAKNYLCAN